ncbi:MAG: hypothetical protein V1804_04700 [Patescibacteria group bacterium]
MNIEIWLKKGTVCLKIVKNRKTVECIEFSENNNLSMILLEKIDALLKKNKLSKKETNNISVKSEMPDSYTSSRIARSLEKSFNFAIKLK